MPADDGAIATATLLARYDGRAPRYTSYPTALHFTPETGAEDYRGWLGRLPAADPISVYLHVPFCRSLCWYCGCNTRVVRDPAIISKYVDFLEREFELVEAALPGRLTAGALHLGGGTPNTLSTDDLDRTFAHLRRMFRLDEAAEISVEIDPAALSCDWVEAAARNGLTRASLGVQDLSPAVQAAVNRIEPFETVRRAVGWLRAAGVASINLDLMYGLPRQGVAEVEATLDEVLTLRPERLALFGYAHVPWARAHQRLINDRELADAAGRLEQSEAAADRLLWEGYVRIGLDHYALPDDPLAQAHARGELRRNFQGYTADPHATLLAFGVSAIGQLPQGFVQNEAGEAAWRTALAKGRLPVKRGLAFTDDDRFRADIIERLMCDLAVDLADARRRHGRPVESLAAEREALLPLQAAGLITLDDERVAMTPLGRPFLRTVAQVFDARSAPDAAYSRVV